MKTTQKMTLITVLLFTGIFTSKSQNYVLIPDANFATYLKSLIPSAMNGSSLNITNTLVTTGTQTIIVSGLNISDLSGIQYFNSLKLLDCSSNNLINLPALPKTLTGLICYHNFLTSIPTLPNSLTELNCQFNSLTNLPTLPFSLTMLQCHSNQITHFPSFPKSLTYIDLSSNPYTCLPNHVLPAMKSYTTMPLCGK